MQAERPVQALPTEVVAKLRSSVCTPSLALCVEELVSNSLDAKATCIAVRVDLESLRLQVVDNGHGISSEDLKYIGDRYMTSKCYSLDDLQNVSYFGYRGEFLASLRGISSVLEVASRLKGERRTFSKLFKKGEVCEISPVKEKRSTHGTTITAYNVYYNLPVRQKSIKVALDLERIRRSLEAFAIIHHHVSFSLRDDCSGSKLIQTHSTQSPKSAFGFLFGHAKSKALREVTNSNKKFTVKGYFGVECHVNNHLQFVYVNKRAVLRTKIHKLVKHGLKQSYLFKSQRCGKESPVNPDFLSLCDRSSPRPRGSGGEFAVYVLDIRCLRTEYDILPNTTQTFLEFHDWPGVSSCIEQAVQLFLIKENLTLSSNLEDEAANDTSESEDSSDEEIDEIIPQRLPVPPSRLAKLQKYGFNISTKNCSNNMQSKLVTRAHLRTKGEKGDQTWHNDSCNSDVNVPEDDNRKVRGKGSTREGSSKEEGNYVASRASCAPVDLERSVEESLLSSDDNSGSGTMGYVDQHHQQRKQQSPSEKEILAVDAVQKGETLRCIQTEKPDGKVMLSEINPKSLGSEERPTLVNSNLFDVDKEKSAEECQSTGSAEMSSKLVPKVSGDSCAVGHSDKSVLTSDILSTGSSKFSSQNQQHISASNSLTRKVAMVSSPDGQYKRRDHCSSNQLESHRADEGKTHFQVRTCGITPEREEDISPQAKSSLLKETSEEEKQSLKDVSKHASFEKPETPNIGKLMEGDQSMGTETQTVPQKYQQKVGSSDASAHASSSKVKEILTSNRYVSSLHRFKEGLRSKPVNVSVNLASKISEALNKSQEKCSIFPPTKGTKRKTLSMAEMRHRWFPTFEQDMKGDEEGDVSVEQNRRHSYPLSHELAVRQTSASSKCDEEPTGFSSNQEEFGVTEKVDHISLFPSHEEDRREGKVAMDRTGINSNVEFETSFPIDRNVVKSGPAEKRSHNVDQSHTSNRMQQSDQQSWLPDEDGEDVNLNSLPSSAEASNYSRRSPPLVQRRNFNQDGLFLDQSFQKYAQSGSLRSLRVKQTLPSDSEGPQTKHKVVRTDSMHHASTSNSKQQSFMSTGSFVISAQDLLPQRDKSEVERAGCSTTGNSSQREYSLTDSESMRLHDNHKMAAGMTKQSHPKQVQGSKTCKPDVAAYSVDSFRPDGVRRKLLKQGIGYVTRDEYLDDVDSENQGREISYTRENRYPSNDENEPRQTELSPSCKNLTISEKQHQELLAILDSSPFCSFPSESRNCVADQTDTSQRHLVETYGDEEILSTQPFHVQSSEQGNYLVNQCNPSETQQSADASPVATTQPFVIPSPVETPPGASWTQMELDLESLVSGSDAKLAIQVVKDDEADINVNQSKTSDEDFPVVSSQLSQRTLDDLKTLSEEDIRLLTVIERQSISPPSVKEKGTERGDELDVNLVQCSVDGTDEMSDSSQQESKSTNQPCDSQGANTVATKSKENFNTDTRTKVILNDNHTFALERETVNPVALSAGRDNLKANVGTSNDDQQDAAGVNTTKSQTTNAPKFVKYSAKNVVPFYERVRTEEGKSDEERKGGLSNKQSTQEVVSAPSDVPQGEQRYFVGFCPSTYFGS